MKKFLSILLFVISLNSFAQLKWEGHGNVPVKWIMLERDSLGYLIYDPCNGGTPMITIDTGYISVYWWLDAPSTMHINKFTSLGGNRSFFINASDEESDIEFTAILKDEKQILVLWTFGDFRWVMTPYENRYQFRFVDNPCVTEMKPEKQFLPIEF